MHTSRLGKFVIVLAGAIGLLCVGGGHAHADSVSVQSQSSNNVSVSSNSVSNDSTGGSTTLINDNSQTGSAVSNSSNNTGPTTGPVAAATQTDTSNGSNKSIGAVPNSEIPQSAVLSSGDNTATTPANAIVASADANGGSGTLVNSTVTQPTAVKAAYYPPRQIQATVISSDQTLPVAAAKTDGNSPQPQQPTMPQGAFVLVATAGAPSPLVKFLGGLSGLQILHRAGVTAVLILLLAVFSGLVASVFISYLKASGYAVAPRGSTPIFNFAFPVGESRLSNKLKTDSLFSTPQRLLGGWWYQGGRI